MGTLEENTVLTVHLCSDDRENEGILDMSTIDPKTGPKNADQRAFEPEALLRAEIATKLVIEELRAGRIEMHKPLSRKAGAAQAVAMAAEIINQSMPPYL